VITVAEVRLWGKTIGAVSIDDQEEVAAFEYDEAFSQSGMEVAPLMMPLSRRIHRFPVLPRHTFHGLPGLLADSLPDRFGNALIDAWLARQGRGPSSFNAVERLCYTGKRGMGALEYIPALGPETAKSTRVELDRLVELASEVLSHREGFQTNLKDDQGGAALKQILQVGTSAGGARAKAVIAWHPATGEVLSGQVRAPEGFEYWLLKFDGVNSNRDKELEDPKGYGAIEYAYHLMATAAGIDMSPCRLLEENGRRHFMTRRFDRTREGQKLHMQSLGAMAHFDYNSAGAYSYEQAFGIIRTLGLGLEGIERQYRRMAFNVLARNQDDHVKNIAFLMDKEGRWRLAPAFDVTWSYQPDGLWTGTHQMSLNGRRDGFTLDDFKTAARGAGMKRGRAETILAEVAEATARWPEFADAAGVPGTDAARIGVTFRSIE